jgi:hypothetical protein
MSIALNYRKKIPDSPELSGLLVVFSPQIGFMRLAFTCPLIPAPFPLKLFQTTPPHDPRPVGADSMPLIRGSWLTIHG